MSKNSTFNLLRSMRIQQWPKNLLIFLPMLLAHSYHQIALWQNAFIAFISFSLAASSIYILNDIADLDNDRCHAEKKNRPLASGAITVPAALILFLITIAISILISIFSTYQFQIILLCYVTGNIFYSFILKKVEILDVILLALMYTARLFAGSMATGTAISPWLMAYSLFLFLSLAFLKRYSEIYSLKESNIKEVKGRGYLCSDLQNVFSLGSSCGYLSIVIFSLYINQPETLNLYSKPHVLWGIAVIFLYWINSLWIRAGRGEVQQDPFIFAITDKKGLISFFLIIVLLILAK